MAILLTIGILYFNRKDPYLKNRIALTKIFDKDTIVQSVKLSELIPVSTPVTIYIDKSDYRLSVFSGNSVVKTYKVVFGGNPKDDKLRQGDQCTPEGTFYIKTKYPHRSWNKFIWLDYPNAQSWEKHNKAKREGIIPADAKIGGEIGIHGVPEGKDFAIDQRINWTLGCISLKNSDLDEIYPYITKKTPIKIQK